MRSAPRPLLVLALGLGALPCGCGTPSPTATGGAATGAPVPDDPPPAPEPPVDECLERWEKIVRDGTGALDAGLPGPEHGFPVLLHAKGSALWFRTPPASSPAELDVLSGDDQLRRDAERFWSADRPERLLDTLLHRHRRHPEELRAALLRDGVLYTESPRHARALVTRLTLDELLTEDPAWLRRGAAVLELDRRRWGYELLEPISGRTQRATLILYDRLGTTAEEVAAAPAVDLGALKDRYALDRLRFEAAHEGLLAATLWFAGSTDEWRGLLRDAGAELVLECVAGGAAADAARQVADDLFAWRLQLRRAVEEQVAENLFFDEPEVEIGQQDGKLREAWSLAYQQGLETYEVNGVSYDVFADDGTPLVPQVCIDFVLDTYERASGRWFRPRGEPPGRTPGFLAFRELEGFERRTVPGVVRWAGEHPEVFDLYEVPAEDRVPYKRGAEFEAAVLRLSAQLQEGDLVVIYGLREEDQAFHYHSFLVHRQHPVSGLPIALALNAGHARVVTLRDAMQNAPQRSIRWRVRPRWEWIRERMAAFEATAAEEGAP